MHRRTIGLSAIVAATLAIGANSVTAQQRPLKEQLIGTWIMVSAVATTKEGTKSSDRWSANPKGQIIFGADGRYSFMISRPDIPKFAANNPNQGSAEENSAAVRGTIANFGTWSVDESTKTITTNVEASTFPNLNGNSQKRVINSLTADELKYTNPAAVTGTVDEAVWRRSK